MSVLLTYNWIYVKFKVYIGIGDVDAPTNNMACIHVQTKESRSADDTEIPRNLHSKKKRKKEKQVIPFAGKQTQLH